MRTAILALVVVAAITAPFVFASLAMGEAVQLDTPYSNLGSGVLFHNAAATSGTSRIPTMDGRPMQALIYADGKIVYWLDARDVSDRSTGFVVEDDYLELITPEQVVGFGFLPHIDEGASGASCYYNVEGKR